MNLDAEWLEADGRGGFASGTAGGVRTRRYHALLLATRPPVARVALIHRRACARWLPGSWDVAGNTRAGRCGATAPATRERSGRGCSAPSSGAWVRVQGDNPDVRERALQRFVEPLPAPLPD